MNKRIYDMAKKIAEADGGGPLEYKVYIQDTDGSERLGSTITANSKAQARKIAKKQGLKNITSIELKQGGMAMNKRIYAYSNRHFK